MNTENHEFETIKITVKCHHTATIVVDGKSWQPTELEVLATVGSEDPWIKVTLSDLVPFSAESDVECHLPGSRRQPTHLCMTPETRTDAYKPLGPTSRILHLRAKGPDQNEKLKQWIRDTACRLP